jgi:hypothetical protein
MENPVQQAHTKCSPAQLTHHDKASVAYQTALQVSMWPSTSFSVILLCIADPEDSWLSHIWKL